MRDSRRFKQFVGLGLLLVTATGSALGAGGAWLALMLVAAGGLLWVALSDFRARRQLPRRVEGLEGFQVLRALGLPHRLRGELDGAAVHVGVGGVEVRLPRTTGARRRYDAQALQTLCQASPLSEAATALCEAGVRELHVEGDLLELHGGHGAVAPLIRAARTLASGSPQPALGLRPAGRGGCPYCHQAVSFHEEAARRCDACDALHHAACWEEHGGCSVFGCARAPAAGREARQPPAPEKTAG